MRQDIAVFRSCPSQKDKSVARGQSISFSFPPFAGWVKRIILACTAIFLLQLIVARVFGISLCLGATNGSR